VLLVVETAAQHLLLDKMRLQIQVQAVVVRGMTFLLVEAAMVALA